MEGPTCHAGNFWSSRLNASLDSLVSKLLLRQAENHSLIYENYNVMFLVHLNKTFVLK